MMREVQAVLARLYTDSRFRAQFFTDMPAACAEAALTEPERQQLARLDRRQVERYARSLHRKRLEGIGALLPASARLLRDTFDARFRDYCDAHRSAGERIEEANDFAGFLLDSEPIENRLQRDVVTCERLRLEVIYSIAEETPTSAAVSLEARPQLTPRAQIAECGYDLEALYPRLLRREPTDFTPDPSTILIGKVRGELRAKLKRINGATAELLARCDGARTGGIIVDEVAAQLRLSAAERRKFAEECLALVSSLSASGLIAFFR